eukprot:TRINITY_DN39766_c0_g1_i1.p1 TRINITY_DN39766_c0_g1~~TRINITY_DN39766_c0_g1_i1.p1  ORF type:complete len:307 (+),score=50.39 TRINITY_DN39766_c0_g1_i1:130-1050(+)
MSDGGVAQSGGMQSQAEIKDLVDIRDMEVLEKLEHRYQSLLRLRREGERGGVVAESLTCLGETVSVIPWLTLLSCVPILVGIRLMREQVGALEEIAQYTVELAILSSDTVTDLLSWFELTVLAIMALAVAAVLAAFPAQGVARELFFGAPKDTVTFVVQLLVGPVAMFAILAMLGMVFVAVAVCLFGTLPAMTLLMFASAACEQGTDAAKAFAKAVASATDMVDDEQVSVGMGVFCAGSHDSASAKSGLFVRGMFLLIVGLAFLLACHASNLEKAAGMDDVEEQEARRLVMEYDQARSKRHGLGHD